MNSPDGIVVLIAGFIAVVGSLVLVVALWSFLSGTRRRYRQCGNLWRALSEAHVTPPLGEFPVRVFGSRPGTLRVFRHEDSAGVVVEIRPNGWLSYARHEFEIAPQQFQALARALRAK